MKCNTASQFRPFCDCCERDNSSEWVQKRQRYECDDCQRDQLTKTLHSITTWFEHPPIPLRDYDYGASEADYEPGRPIGWGRTEQEAIADLLSQLED